MLIRTSGRIKKNIRLQNSTFRFFDRDQIAKLINVLVIDFYLYKVETLFHNSCPEMAKNLTFTIWLRYSFVLKCILYAFRQLFISL